MYYIRRNYNGGEYQYLMDPTKTVCWTDHFERAIPMSYVEAIHMQRKESLGNFDFVITIYPGPMMIGQVINVLHS